MKVMHIAGFKKFITLYIIKKFMYLIVLTKINLPFSSIFSWMFWNILSWGRAILNCLSRKKEYFSQMWIILFDNLESNCPVKNYNNSFVQIMLVLRRTSFCFSSTWISNWYFLSVSYNMPHYSFIHSFIHVFNT